MRLRRAPGLLLCPVDDGYLAFAPASRCLHHLNPTAALVVELCDGSGTLDDLRDELLALVPRQDWDLCAAWVHGAVREGLLQISDQPNAAPHTAATLLALAGELSEEGRPLEAFICQQRAVELDPAEPHAWYTLGELAHMVGRRGDARLAYERYASHHPEDAEIAHILTALRDESPPERAPRACIEQLYARFASFYDHNMSEDLDYRAPALVGEALDRSDAGNGLRVLDLGCGTGMSGAAIRRRATHLTGLDLSPEMIALARERGAYDALHVGEITEWLAGPGEAYDVIVACDALIYFGDLRQVIVPAARRLAPGGRLAFTVERGDTAPFHLSDSGRFTHRASHIEDAARDAGLIVSSLEDGVLRHEYGEPVHGLIAILQRVPEGAAHASTGN